MKARTWVLVLGTIGAGLAMTIAAASCDKTFDGPYPCAPGFASCTTPNACETLTTSDGTSCGACEHRCSPGAACTNGVCGEAPLFFESTSAPSDLALYGSTLFWATGTNSTGNSLGVASVSLFGGAVTAVVSSGVSSCNNSPPFVVDSTNVYYFTPSSPTELVARPIPVRASGLDGGSEAGIRLDAGGGSCGALDLCCPSLPADGGPLGPSSRSTCISMASGGSDPTCAGDLGNLQESGFCGCAALASCCAAIANQPNGQACATTVENGDSNSCTSTLMSLVDTGACGCSALQSCCDSLPIPERQACVPVIQLGDDQACDKVLAANSTLCERKGPDAGGGDAGQPQATLTSSVSCGPLGLSKSSLYFASSGNSGCTTGCEQPPVTFYTLPTSARFGVPTTLGSAADLDPGEGFVVAGGTIYFGGCEPNNGSCNVLTSIPASGAGSVTYGQSLPNGNGEGQGPVTADANDVYVVYSGWDCNDYENSNNNNTSNDNGGGCGGQNQTCCGTTCNQGFTCASPGTEGVPLTSSPLCVPGGDAGAGGILTGGTTVVASPVNGGPPTVLAQTHDGTPATSIAVDSVNVYWATGTSAWMVPKAGGTATPIAGNLGPAVPPCSGNGSVNTNTNSVSVLSDGAYVYIASPANNAIYRIPVPH